MYRSWQTHLSPQIQLCPVELPGRGQRFNESPFQTLPSLIADLGAALLPHLNRPFAFFGHSMGALISFELARWLRSHQSPLPQHLFVSGRSAPSLPPTAPAIHTVSDEQFIAELRHYAGTPEAILQHPELMQILLPTLRADFKLLETYEYHPQAPLPFPITALGSFADSVAPPATLEDWQIETSEQFNLRMFPGDHFFLQGAEPPLAELCAQALCPEGLKH
ncbi:Linear gramicidin dehydrogenase LgrE [Acaryochloris thomasi RCC1774]|uniref:Linear gramicidin dehydrogenase LgrE n=2 Tax=Acaryochloris TaxID=155977 RepID=A0A2W1JP39_9CYAN|nr:Linear gramicidin dehydrogenase LgrE [Acaryochloris thomasi RCC1774]